MMNDPLNSVSGTTGDESAPATAHGLSLTRALILTIICAIVVVGGSVAVAHAAATSTAAKASLSLLTLAAFIALSHSAFQLVLALIATTGERRWFSRQVSERRTGDRARKPPSS